MKKNYRGLLVFVSLLIAFLFISSATVTYGKEIVRNDYYIQSTDDPEIRIYVREKYNNTTDPKRAGKAVLFCHGATYPGDTFDCPVEGYSWMDYAVNHGYVAYYIDIRGYGRSTRPAVMNEDAAKNKPIVRFTTAMEDVDDVVDFIRKRTNVEKVSLIGWSWGTVISGGYATEHGDKIDKLVLYAPVYNNEVPAWTTNLKDPNNPDQIKPDIGAYRLVSEEAAKSRWGKQIVPEDKTEWREEQVFKAWIDDIMANDPDRDKHSPPKFRAPNGVLVDIFYIFTKRPVYDASKITVPTLIIRGNDDPTATEPDAKGLMAEIKAPVKRYISIANGTHFVGLEKNRLQLFREVQTFLDE